MSERSIPYVIFITAAAAYIACAAPLVTAGDSGELAAAAFCLGIPHPPGYPLYSIAGKGMMMFPFGEATFRLGLLSAFCTALSAVLIYAISSVVAGSRAGVAAAAVASAWALGSAAWGQAVYPEVYPLQLAISLSAVYSALLSARRADYRWFYLSSFLSGLSVSAHFAGLVFMPALIAFALLAGSLRLTSRSISVNTCFFFMGLSPFVYLPIRSAAFPEANWGNPSNISRLISHVSRSSYGDLGSMVSSLAGGWKGPLLLMAVSAAVAASLFAVRKKVVSPPVAAVWLLALIFTGISCIMAVSGATVSKAVYFAGMAWSSGSALAIPLAAIGLGVAYKRDRKVFIYLSLLIVTVGLVTFFRVPEPGMYNFQSLADKFFLPFGALVFVSAAAGGAAAGEWLKGKNVHASYVPYLFLAVPVSLAAVNYGTSDRSRDFVAQDYSISILRTLPQESIFLAEGDNHIFLILYQRVVGDMRKDVGVYTQSSVSPFPSGEAILAAMADRRRTVYSSNDTLSGIRLAPAGLLNVMPPGPPARNRDTWSLYYVRTEAGGRPPDFLTSFMLADYFFAWARDEMQRGDLERAMELLDRAAEAGRDLIWVNVGIGGIYLEYGYPEKARTLFERAIGVAPANPDAWLGMGRFYKAAGSLDEAGKCLERAVSLNRRLGAAWLLLSEVRQEKGDYRGAYDALSGYVNSGIPDAEKVRYRERARLLQNMAGQSQKSE